MCIICTAYGEPFKKWTGKMWYAQHLDGKMPLCNAKQRKK